MSDILPAPRIAKSTREPEPPPQRKPKYKRKIDPPPPDAAYTIKGFCRAFHISAAFYFRLKKDGQTPREIKLGRRRLISAAAAEQWRIEREAAAAEAAAK